MNKTYRAILIVLSLIALLNVIFVPIFDMWGGLFPESVEYDFFDVMDMVMNDDNCWDYRVVALTMSIFVPTVLMFVMALLGSKPLFLIVDAVGIILVVKQLIDYSDQVGNLSKIFDTSWTSISIGNWTALGLFGISFLVALFSKKKKSNSED